MAILGPAKAYPAMMARKTKKEFRAAGIVVVMRSPVVLAQLHHTTFVPLALLAVTDNRVIQRLLAEGSARC
jgi:hypothetical protein